MRALVALLVVVGIVMGACSGSTEQGPSASSGSGSSSLTLPLPSGDHVAAFREAEAKLRKEGREKAELAKLGPGALELAGFMDQTASFLLAQLPRRLTALGSPRGAGGRLAAPLAGLPPPGAPVFGTYLMTTVLFSDLIGQVEAGTKSATLDPTTDEVTVSGNKGNITTTTTATVTASGSKVSLDITMKVEGEVRDAATGAILYRISSEATGHADGDGCPDASGTARARMAFTGKEDYFNASGAKTGTRVSEGFGGEIRFKVDDNAKLSGVDLSPSGHGAEIMLRIAATSAAPAFEKAWRSGSCIEVIVDPKGGEVDSESVTDLTVKVKHKIEGNELDKPVEGKLAHGVKSIDPAGSKQKAPAKFRYTAGSESGDVGGVRFESVSNRGIGQGGATFTVGGGWTISSVGTSTEVVEAAGTRISVQVSFTDVKVTAAKDNALSGSGPIRLKGSLDARLGDVVCTAPIDRTFPFTVAGSLVGTGPAALLKLTISAPTPPGETLRMTCDYGTIDFPLPGEGNFYGFALGELELPAAGGTKSFDRSVVVGGLASVRATATVTVLRPKR